MAMKVRRELIEDSVNECLEELELEDYDDEVMELVEIALDMGYFSSITANSIAATSVYCLGMLEGLGITQRDAAYHCGTHRRIIGEHYPTLLHEYNERSKDQD